MELVDPEECVRDEKITNLVTPVVEDERAPIRMLTEPWIIVLVECRPVEPSKRIIVLRKVGRHPIENDADVVLMQLINEKAKVVRVSIARRRSEVAADLVAP